jgi:osmoprotectant transport system ATP-binding protein
MVPAGQVCVLVGPSGCGKTTTLKMVNRLVEPSSGQVLIDGEDVMKAEPTALRRRVGYVIQQIGLFPHQTIEENVVTVPRLLGWPKERLRERADELIALVGLLPEKVRHRYPSQLSGGERQRIGVARALAAEPPVLLMDEPFGAVDPIERERLQNEFLRLHRQLRTTVLFVTHDIDEAIKMGDRVAVMRKGSLVQYATPETLLAAPADDFVARFVGADRGLKRLALVRVSDVPLQQAPVARVGEPAGTARTRAGDADYLLLLAADGRPIGWVAATRLPPEQPLTPDLADPSSPFLTSESTLRDALSLLLATDVQTGVVVDERGRYRGAIGAADIATVLRPTSDRDRVQVA